jgi:putative ABC transport system permease protein
MIRNYLKIAFRNIFRNPFYSFISITGLAAGITASALILLFVSHEYSFDKFHKNAENIYRILAQVSWGGEETQINSLSAPFGPRLKESSPEVVDYVLTKMAGKVVLESDADF